MSFSASSPIQDFFKDPLIRGTRKLIAINLAVFVLGALFIELDQFFNHYGVLNATEPWKIWQPLTYMFLHANGSHVFWNMLMLLFVGMAVERGLGTREFMRLYLFCGITAGIISYLFQGVLILLGSPIELSVVGASGAIYGLFYSMYRLYPDAKVLLWFIIPVPIKYVLIAVLLFSSLSLFDAGSGVAHFAHLGGLFAGFAYFRYLDRFEIWKATWEQKKALKAENREAKMHFKLDEVLKKVKEEGMNSLTASEKRFLQETSKKFREKR